MLSLNQVNRILTILSVAGVAVSIYALIVETKKEHDDSYEAMCDISEQMSCSRVLSSRWGRGFGIIGLLLGEDSVLNQPNSVSGILFYSLLAFLSRSDSKKKTKVLLILTAISNVMSVYLASILYFILYDFCIVCVTTYMINILLLVSAFQKHRLVLSENKHKKS